jgi:hypothetical protein
MMRRNHPLENRLFYREYKKNNWRRFQREYKETTRNQYLPKPNQQQNPRTTLSLRRCLSPWRNHTERRSRIHRHSGPRRVEKSSYRMHPPRSPRNNRASLVGASALRGGLMSRINDDMLVGAIATSASLWIPGITIAVCYLMIRRYGEYEGIMGELRRGFR